MILKIKFCFFLYLGLLSGGLALFLQIVSASPSLSVINKSFPLNSFLFPFFFCLSFLFLLATSKIISFLFLRKEPQASKIKTLIIIFFPIGYFLSAPLLFHFYWSRQDLTLRLLRLALLVCLTCLVLALIQLEKLKNNVRRKISSLIEKFSSRPMGQKLALLFFVAFFAYQTTTLLLVLQGVTFSGDEPNYLLTTHSLLYDGDINLANNYARQDYFAFYSKEEHPRLKLGIYGRYGKKGKDYIYPINLPGISVLIIPFYALSQLFKGKILTFILKGSLSLWAALFCLQIYLLARQRWRREGLALGLWLTTAFVPPVLFYSCHLYPEIPIAFFSLLIFRELIFSQQISWIEAGGLGLLLATFPWFGLKYNFLFWPLFFIGFYKFWRDQQKIKKLIAFIFLPLISQFLFYLFIYHLYGTFSPIAIYEGVMSAEQMKAFWQMVLAIPLSLRLESFLDYFLDQRDGLLLYAPIYFFALTGFIDLWKRSRKIFLALLFVCLPFLFNYSFLTHRQGYSPQGRVLTPIIWIGIIALGEFLANNKKKFFYHLFLFSWVISVFFVMILISNPPFLYQPTTHEYTSRPGDLFVYLSNTHFFLPPFLPSFIKVNNLSYWPNYVWIALIVIFLLVYAFSRHKLIINYGFTWPALLALSLIIYSLRILFPSPPLYPVKTINYSPQRPLGFYLFYLGRGVVVKEEGDFYLHLEKPYRFIIGSKQELKEIELALGSSTGDYEISLRAFDLPLIKTRVNQETKKLRVNLPPPYKKRHLFLYEINLDMKHLSRESMQIEPFMIQFIPGRR